MRAVSRWVGAHLGTRAPRATLPPPSPRVVISLTTVPSRVGGLRPALNSLLAQDHPPAAVYLSVPRYSIRERTGYALPPSLEQGRGVTVIRTERDWGPATKLLPALRAEGERPDTLIIVVDDDNVYPPEMVSTFVRWSRELPGAALAFRGWTVPPSGRWRDSREVFATRLAAPARMDVVTGCGGVMVKPAFFDEAVFEYAAAPDSAFFVDDIWMSGHLARRGVPRYVVPSPAAFVYLPTLPTLRSRGLDRTDNAPGSTHNDVMLDYFRPHWGGPR